MHVLVGSWGQPEALLRDGRADMALLRSPFDRRGTEAEELLSEPRVAALPAVTGSPTAPGCAAPTWPPNHYPVGRSRPGRHRLLGRA